MKIKICGLTRMYDIMTVNDEKPEYIGFVFADSKRKVSPEQVLFLRKNLSEDIVPVGVFVNESIHVVSALLKNGVIDAVQLHGDEDEKYISKLKSLTGKTIIKAVPVINPGDVQKWSDTAADFLLLDKKGGGTGRIFDWSLIGNINKPYFLAGGLNINNIDEAIKKTSPFGVDISSGVETGGFKNREKIKSIIRRIRND